MASRNWLISTDASVITNASLGNTVDQHHPVGKHLTSGNVYRAYLKFTMDYTSMVTITQARLYMRRCAVTHIDADSSNSVRVRKLTATPGNTQGGSAEGTWSSSALPKAAVASTTTNQSAATTLGTTSGTWYYIDITAMAQAWLAGGTHYGVEVKAESETSNANAWEFYSKDSSSDPYISVTYTTNVIPSQPTINSPASGTRIAGPSATYNFTHVDSDGDALLNYDIQVSTDSTFASVTHWNAASQTAGISGNIVNIAHGGSALSRNTWYYWRVATRSATGTTGVGPWSGTKQFYINNLPTATLTDPATTGYLGHMVYTAGSGWASPRLRVTWSYSDVDSDAQASYQVVITSSTTAGGSYSAFYDSGVVNSADNSIAIPATFIEGSFYKTYVLVKDAYGEWSTAQQNIIVRARWATATHRKDVNVVGNIPTSWDVTTLDTTTTGTSAVTVEYNSTTDGTTSLGTWMSTLSSVTKRKWVHYRVWLMCWGSATPASPSLDKIVVTASGLTLTPDHWTNWDAYKTIDVGTRVFGSQSLAITTDSATQRDTWQVITVDQNTDYILSGRIKRSNASVVALAQAIMGGVEVAAITASGTSTDWEYYTAAPFNTGSNSTVTVNCLAKTAAGTSWFDGLKLERGRVASPWAPGLVGTATTVDAGGLQVDGFAGGKFRLRGTVGGSRDTVELSLKGLKFGGDTEVSSPYQHMAYVQEAAFVSSGAAATGTGSGTLGYWAKMGHGEILSQYEEITLMAVIQHTGSSTGEVPHGRVHIRVKQQAAFGSQPAVAIDSLGSQNPVDIGVFVTSVAGPTTFEVWVKTAQAYGGPVLAVQQVSGFYGSNYYPDSLVAVQAGLPSGTAYYGGSTPILGALRTGGTAFPTVGLGNGDRFWRTDLYMEFSWDTSRWNCVCLHEVEYRFDTAIPISVSTSARVGIFSGMGPFASSNINLLNLNTAFHVAGGTALSASHKWVGTIVGAGAGGSTSVISIDSGASSVWRSRTDVLSVTAGSGLTGQIDWVKTGSPGTLYAITTLNYRLVAT